MNTIYVLKLNTSTLFQIASLYLLIELLSGKHASAASEYLCKKRTPSVTHNLCATSVLTTSQKNLSFLVLAEARPEDKGALELPESVKPQLHLRAF